MRPEEDERADSAHGKGSHRLPSVGREALATRPAGTGFIRRILLSCGTESRVLVRSAVTSARDTRPLREGFPGSNFCHQGKTGERVTLAGAHATTDGSPWGALGPVGGGGFALDTSLRGKVTGDARQGCSLDRQIQNQTWRYSRDLPPGPIQNAHGFEGNGTSVQNQQRPSFQWPLAACAH